LDGISMGGNLMSNGGSFRDAAGNDALPALNTISPTDGVLVYAMHPTLTLSTVADVPVNGAFTVTAMFSEPVTGFTLNDITVDNATLSDLQTADNTEYTVVATPLIGGSVEFSVVADVAVNVANNGNEASILLVVHFNSIITGITLEDGCFVYEGTTQSMDIAGAQPQGTTESYPGNSRTTVRTQKVTPAISGDNNDVLV